ncbi:hypothetical protein ABW19_dt0201473 [Dactylella cylindrospora]|nr:hypothetical protein ABW19_dt0201473 [Dactylella cylindrospora]
MSLSHPLYIVTYDRGTHWRTGRPKAYHWAFLIEFSSTRGIKHQLRGMPGGYYYPGPEDASPEKGQPGKTISTVSTADAHNDVDIDGALAHRVVEKLGIGSVSTDDPNMLEQFESVSKAAYIETEEDKGGEGKWNCQDWCLGVLEGLQSTSVVNDVWYSGTEIWQWLREKGKE